MTASCSLAGSSEQTAGVGWGGTPPCPPDSRGRVAELTERGRMRVVRPARPWPLGNTTATRASPAEGALCCLLESELSPACVSGPAAHPEQTRECAQRAPQRRGPFCSLCPSSHRGALRSLGSRPQDSCSLASRFLAAPPSLCSPAHLGLPCLGCSPPPPFLSPCPHRDPA